MISAYQTYIRIDSFGVVFKKIEGKYVGHIMVTRNNRAVLTPVSDEFYSIFHKMIETYTDHFTKVEADDAKQTKVGFSGVFEL